MSPSNTQTIPWSVTVHPSLIWHPSNSTLESKSQISWINKKILNSLTPRMNSWFPSMICVSDKDLHPCCIVFKEENVEIFRRYIAADISCIEGFRRDISWRNIGPAIFWDLSREIGDFSRYIGDLAINRRFFSDISRGQCGSTKVRPATMPVNAL